MPLAAGTRVGNYEIFALIGEGGMGEVYRARDVKLGRDVALKALPASFASDPGRRARLLREAQLLATLNHPHIASIYGLEEIDGADVIAMELVEGPALDDRLRTGPLPVDEVIKIARQLAEALEAAHEKNVIHRDLKPSNLKLSSDGMIKVLDFGLARAMYRASVPGDRETAPTVTIEAVGGLTGVGVILGTIPYMSPEQARGETVDRRADIWSFGAVLYELLTGRAAFPGKTAVDVMAAVMTSDPDYGKLPADTPAWLVHLIRRCLVRDRRKRLQAIGEARLMIEEAQEGSVKDPQDGPAAFARRRRGWLAAGAILAAVLAAGAYYYLRQPAPVSGSYIVSIDPPEGNEFHFGNRTGGAAISPDGKVLVFSASSHVQSRLWLRRMDSLTPRALAGTERAAHPFWSPDSQWIAFFADRKLKKLPVSGGPIETLADAPTPRGGTWNADGVIVFTPGTGSGGFLHRIPSGGGQAEPLPKPPDAVEETAHYWPRFFDQGRKFLYAARKGQMEWTLFAAPLDDPAKRVKVAGTYSQAYVVPATNGLGNYLVWMRERDVLSFQPFDVNQLALAGEATPLVTDVDRMHVIARGNFTVASTGALVAGTGSVLWTKLHLVARDGKDLGPVSEAGVWNVFRISPDGRRLVASRSSEGDDLWLIDLQRKVTSRFTFDTKANHSGVWSPDGRWIAYSSAWADIKKKEASGQGIEHMVVEGGRSVGYPTSWTPDGKAVTVQRGGNMYLLPVEGRPEEQTLLAEPFAEVEGQLSPSGKWFAYTSDESGESQVYLRSFPSMGGKTQISRGGGRAPRWKSDESELYFLSADSQLMAVSIGAATTSTRYGVPQQLFQIERDPSLFAIGPDYEAFPNGLQFIVRRKAGEDRRSMKLLLNWQAGFPR